MSQLTYLMDEICAGVEIYYTGRQGGQYLKTAFILCDDYTELTSKLFLLTKNPSWSDTKANGKYKNYYDIQQNVQAEFAAGSAELAQIQAFHTRMKARRDRRNDFFHSTHLLDLSVTPRNCIEAFLDLLNYGELICGSDWTTELQASRNLDSLSIFLKLEHKSFSDPSIMYKVNDILRDSRCNISKLPRNAKGVHVATHPEDLHLRLCVIHGGQELRDKLSALIP
ncbi:MAG: hypothetical protein V7K92_27850 [Nostoc sp.]|uniref:hypothetical protein n=1 Tax=Nostoc sp. TaxID=1180 RepID=UPI002FF32A50